LDQPLALLWVGEDLAPRHVLRVHEPEHVPPGGLQHSVRALPGQRGGDVLGLLAPEGQQDHPAWGVPQKAPRDGLAYEAVGPEDQDASVSDVHAVFAAGETYPRAADGADRSGRPTQASCSRTTASLPTFWKRERDAA